ncbi:MAG: TetR/AcrR family transcriptional regulator [Clostridia bacterium]|nr:TetR/AcrR family transcriptional regulator [Clostridia bacterium]
MDCHDASDKKQEIIAKTWSYLLRTGLANASVGDLCREEKLSQSSLYYWFENKNDIWISAGRYGLALVVDELFRFTFDHIDRVEEFFDTLLSEVDRFKDALRVAVQITVSPVFGSQMREKNMEFNGIYERYAQEIMTAFGCSCLQAKVFIYSTLAFVVDYAIWDDSEITQMLLDNMYNRIVGVLRLDLPFKGL